MIIKILLTGIVVLLCVTAHAQMKTLMDTTKLISCKLTSPELQERKATVIAELKELVLLREELANGLSYQFQPTEAVLDMLNMFIKTERLCCDFLEFQLTVRTEVVELKITGPEGTKQFLKSEADL